MSNVSCKNHQDCDKKSWCKPKTGLCVCKKPNKCIYGSVCKRDKDCGKSPGQLGRRCNPKFGCICRKKPNLT